MTVQQPDPELLLQLQAIANDKRLLILQWILDPTEYFEPQIDGDLVKDGVCVGRIVDRIGLTQPTVTNHMRVLSKAGLVSAKKIKNWVFYKPDRKAINAVFTHARKALLRKKAG